MFFSATAAVSVAALGLAACDESSSSDINLPARFDSLEDFATAVESGELQLADPAAMTATAQSSGGVEVRNKNGTCDQAAFGVMTQLADFDHVTVTDSVTNNELYDVDANDNCHLNMPLVVTLAVEGTISGTELTADMTGILNHGADFHVDTTMDGTFHDYGGKLSAFGDIEGDYDDQEVSGGFAVIEDCPRSTTTPRMPRQGGRHPLVRTTRIDHAPTQPDPTVRAVRQPSRVPVRVPGRAAPGRKCRDRCPGPSATAAGCPGRAERRQDRTGGEPSFADAADRIARGPYLFPVG